MSRDIFNQIRLLKAPANLTLNVSRDGPLLGVAPTQVQHPALGLVELHEVHTGPLLELVYVSLDDIQSLRHVDCTTQLGLICKLLESALNLTV